MPATCQCASVTAKPCHERAKAPLAPQVPLSRAINPKQLTYLDSYPSGIRATAKSRGLIKGAAGLMGRSGPSTATKEVAVPVRLQGLGEVGQNHR